LHTQIYKQTMNRTTPSYTVTITDVIWIVIDLIFDVHILLFMSKHVDYYYKSLIVVVSLFIFKAFTHIFQCYFYLSLGLKTQPNH